MGIIKASICALQGAAADQWKEAFCAGEMGSELLMSPGKKLTGQNSANEGSDNVITDGSTIIVGEGECAIAIEGGKVIGVYDQPGERIFTSNQSSGIFGGGIGAFFKDVGRRISFGGDVAIRQRLYYINTKELTGGTIRAENIPLRYKDPRTGLDMDGRVSCYGSYTFRITNPERFYKAALRATKERYRTALLQQMDCEVADALAPALALLTQEGVHPNELLQHTEGLRKNLCQVMCGKWSGLRGIEIFSLTLEPVRMEDVAGINTLQQAAAYENPTMAAGRITNAQADALQSATANESGSPVPVIAVPVKMEAQNDGWRCVCGFANKGKYCTECGAKKPADIPQHQCHKCGWKPEDQLHPPKCCPECGDPFDNGDII